MENARWRKVQLLLVSLAIFACMQLSAQAQDAWNVELIGQIGGAIYAVFVDGDYAYVADFDSGLRIIDISNPAVAFEAGYYDTPDYALGVYVSGNYAYVADWDSGLRIIDITNPTAPFEAGYYDTPSFARSVYVSGNYAYVADASGLAIIDITNPAAPFQAGY